MFKYPRYEKNGYSVKDYKEMRGHTEAEVAWSCTLLKNNKPIATVFDDSWGGCLQIDFKDKTEEKNFYDYCKTLPQWKSEHFEKPFDTDGDIFINFLIDDFQFEKKVKKLIKTKTIFSFQDDEQHTYRIVKYPYPMIKDRFQAENKEKKIIVWNEVFA
jgi:hypothetical protein